MISRNELRQIARARLRDAEALFTARRYDCAAYLRGYAVELALKARICRTLKWTEFPSTSAEFSAYQSFRTHNLDVLLRLSGIEPTIRAGYLPDWATASTWYPEMRYSPIVTMAGAQVRQMIDAARRLLRVL
jgi:HEPN domain